MFGGLWWFKVNVIRKESKPIFLML
jgi:hypothetical protein